MMLLRMSETKHTRRRRVMCLLTYFLTLLPVPTVSTRIRVPNTADTSYYLYNCVLKRPPHRGAISEQNKILNTMKAI